MSAYLHLLRFKRFPPAVVQVLLLDVIFQDYLQGEIVTIFLSLKPLLRRNTKKANVHLFSKF